MKVLLTKTSDYKFNEIKEFKDEKEMLEWGIKQENSNGVIINKEDGTDYTMEIYDDYRE